MARQGKEGLRTVTFPQTIKKFIITVTVIFTIITNKFSTSDQLSCTAGSPTKPRSSDALDSVKDSTEILNYLTHPAPTGTQLNTNFNEVTNVITDVLTTSRHPG